MTAPEPPPLTHEPDEGRNRLRVVVVGVLVVVAVAVAFVIATRDEPNQRPSISLYELGTTDAGALPPPAALGSTAPAPIDSDGVTVAAGATTVAAASTELQVSVSAPETHACAAAGTVGETLTLLWTTLGAQSVTVSMGDLEPTPYRTELPTNGSLEMPAPCAGDTTTYYVTAVGADGATATRKVVTTGV